MTNSQRIQLTSAADNALRLLDQIRTQCDSVPANLAVIRELARDASAPLRNALHSLTIEPQTGDQLLQGRIDAAFLWLKAGHRTRSRWVDYIAGNCGPNGGPVKKGGNAS